MRFRSAHCMMNDAPQAPVLRACRHRVARKDLNGRFRPSTSRFGTMPYGGRRRRAEWDHGGRWQWRQPYTGRPSRHVLEHHTVILYVYY